MWGRRANRMDEKCNLYGAIISGWCKSLSISATVCLEVYLKWSTITHLINYRPQGENALMIEDWEIMACLSTQGLERPALYGLIRRSENNVRTEKWSSPVISNISLWSHNSQHCLAVPLFVFDLQLDGHVATRGQNRHQRWREAEENLKYDSRSHSCEIVSR